MLIIPTTQKTEIERITVEVSQSRQKVSETPSQQKKFDMVVVLCYPSYTGSIKEGDSWSLLPEQKGLMFQRNFC
jgi:hypothetical protein